MAGWSGQHLSNIIGFLSGWSPDQLLGLKLFCHYNKYHINQVCSVQIEQDWSHTFCISMDLSLYKPIKELDQLHISGNHTWTITCTSGTYTHSITSVMFSPSFSKSLEDNLSSSSE
jgi:hypothetical protein